MFNIKQGNQYLVIPRQAGDNENVGKAVIVKDVQGVSCMCVSADSDVKLVSPFGKEVKEWVFDADRLVPIMLEATGEKA